MSLAFWISSLQRWTLEVREKCGDVSRSLGFLISTVFRQIRSPFGRRYFLVIQIVTMDISGFDD